MVGGSSARAASGGSSMSTTAVTFMWVASARDISQDETQNASAKKTFDIPAMAARGGEGGTRL